MAVLVIMPRQGQSVESCIISKWHKSIGEKVEIGDLLFSYETDKAAFDEEAKAAGTLLYIFFKEGDDVPVLQNVCIIGEAGENISALIPGATISTVKADSNAAPATTAAAAAPVDPTASAKAVQAASGGSVTAIESDAGISPRARKLALKLGVDYRGIKGSGPKGRIIESDIENLRLHSHVATSAAQNEVLAARPGSFSYLHGTGLGGRITTSDIKNAAAASASSPVSAASAALPVSVASSASPVSAASSASPVSAASSASAASAASASPSIPQTSSAAHPLAYEPGIQAFKEIKISNTRKYIAKAMHLSLSSMAQLTLNSSFDASTILAIRRNFKEGKAGPGYENVTINDIILFSVSRALAGHEALNAHFLEDRMLLFENVNLGLAVDVEKGLMVPTIFNANKKTLTEISNEAKTLVESCKKGSINVDLLKAGTFTVTNLGTLGIESFTPVINPPQTGILGVNNIIWRMKETGGKFEFYPAMGLSLTFDHRALDGAPAARFLKDLGNYLESFNGEF